MLKNFIPYFLFVFFFIAACKKDTFTSVKVTYEVKIADSSIVDITYNSDYYFDSGIRKPVRYVSDGSSWLASHIANKEEEYFIRVDYLSSVNPENDFQVKVYFDNLLVDSVKNDTIVPFVELRGTITN